MHALLAGESTYCCNASHEFLRLRTTPIIQIFWVQKNLQTLRCPDACPKNSPITKVTDQ